MEEKLSKLNQFSSHELHLFLQVHPFSPRPPFVGTRSTAQVWYGQFSEYISSQQQ